METSSLMDFAIHVCSFIRRGKAMSERETESGPIAPATSPVGAGGDRPEQQPDHEALFRKFLETQAPDIVRSHSVPRNGALIIGSIIVLATLANFGVSAYFGWDQSRNLRSQTGIQNLAERAAVADVLSKAVNSLHQALADIDTVSNAFNQYSDGRFIFKGAKLDSWSALRQNFVTDFCTSPGMRTAQACLDGNIDALLRMPSLELSDGSQIQVAMTLEMLAQVDDAISQPSALGPSNLNSGKSIGGILINARDTCENRASGGAASQIEGPVTPGITPSAFAAAITLSSAIDSTIRSARPLFEDYSRLRDDKPLLPTMDRSNTDASIANQVSAFKKSLNLLYKEVRKIPDDGIFNVKSVQEFTVTIGSAFTELKKDLPVIRGDCEKVIGIFGDRLNTITLKSSDLERLTKN
jgi:hypothetical protein